MSDRTEAGTEVADPHAMPWRPATKLFVIFAGYIFAVTAAVIVAVALMLAPTALPDDGAQGSFFKTVSEVVPAMLVIGYFWTFLCAWPGFIAAVIVGERSRWERWPHYAVAGFINVVPSFAMFSIFASSPWNNPIMIAASFPGGFAGGAVYWFVAARFIADRRKPA